MKRMILHTVAWAALVLGGGLGTLGAQAVDFSKSLADFSGAGRPGAGPTVYILDAMLVQYVPFEEEDGTFAVELELLSGRREGLQALQAFRGLVLLRGEAWRAAFPAQRPRTAPPGVVLPNSKVLVMVVLEGYLPEDQGALPVFTAQGFRTL